MRLGRARLDHVGDAIRDFSGWVGDADLLYRPGGATRIRLAAERQVGFSVYQGNEYYVFDEGRVNAVHYLTRIFGLEGEIGRGSLEIPGVERVDRITRYKAGIRIRLPETSIGRRAEYRVSVGRISRDSNDDRFDRSRGTFGIDIVFGY